MNSPEIARYDAAIPLDIAEHVSTIFRRNYPESHPDEERLADLEKRVGAVAIQNLIIEGRTLYVASFQPEDVAGFLESRVVEQENGAYEQLSWIMTDAHYRSLGVAAALHDHFINDAQHRAEQRLPKPSLALLSVNEMNPAEKIYKRWGYEAIEKASTGKIMMIKTLLSKD